MIVRNLYKIIKNQTEYANYFWAPISRVTKNQDSAKFMKPVKSKRNPIANFLMVFPLKSAQDFPDFRKFPKNPNFEIKISRRLLNGFQNFWMIMKGEI